MSAKRPGIAALIALVFVGGLLPAALAAQSYGLGDQVLTVGAASFRGVNHQPVFQSDGYLYNADPGDLNGSIYEAPLRLPDGALVTRLCAYLRNQEPSPSVTLVGMAAVALVPGGSSPAFLSITYVNSSFNSGYEEFCTDTFAYSFHDDEDITFDGISEHVSHRLQVVMPGGATVAFGGARIFWNRQISPAPAQATFADVPPDAPFFLYVEALAASGVTGGCGGGNYCPNAPLTRGQLAVFLAKALGLHWGN
jgi:hypothetical protein